MPSSFPGGLDNWPITRGDSTSQGGTHATEHNNTNDSINKIEAELGVNPKGTDASVVARLARIDSAALAALGTTPQASDATVAARLTRLDATVVNVKNPVYGGGAKGDNSTDDTAAIQAAVTAATTAGATLFFPTGTYLISSAIVIPFSTGWKITGASRLGTTIKQATSNTPIFKFTSDLTHSWTITSLSFTYASAQPASNTSAAAIQFVGTSGTAYNYFNSVITDCNFSNCCDCIASDVGNKQNVWGMTISNIEVASTVSRSFVRFRSSVASGQPNNNFRNIYVRADTMTSQVFALQACETTVMENIEINSSFLGAPILLDDAGGSYTISGLKSEGGSYTGSAVTLFSIPNGDMQIDSLRLMSLTFNAGAVSHLVFGFSGGAAGHKVQVKELTFSSVTVTTGNLYVAQTTTSNTAVEIGHIGGWPVANSNLTNITGTTSADFTQVDEWNAGRVSQDKGDADYTVAIGDPNIISYETALTALRKVTLPNPTAAGDMFNGLRYRVVRSAGGAFDLQIQRAPSTLLDTIVSGKTGVIEYTYRRNAWVQTLKSVF